MGILLKYFKKIIPKVIILLYHRITDSAFDPQLLNVKPNNFAEHLNILLKNYRVLDLRELVLRLRTGCLPARGVVITFDDGYVDNYYKALPLLKDCRTPATIFVTGSYIHNEKKFWWDELTYIFLLSEKLPEMLNFAIRDKEYVWKFQQEVTERDVSFNLNVFKHRNIGVRERAYLEINSLFRMLDNNTIEQIMEHIRKWAGNNKYTKDEVRVLNEEELLSIGENRLIEIGAHTMTHTRLSSLCPADQWKEIVDSKKILESIIKKEVVSFAYPFGGKGDYTKVSRKLIRKAGFKCACSNFPRIVRWGRDVYQLPRYLVRDLDGDKFTQKIEKWFSE